MLVEVHDIKCSGITFSTYENIDLCDHCYYDLKDKTKRCVHLKAKPVWYEKDDKMIRKGCSIKRQEA